MNSKDYGTAKVWSGTKLEKAKVIRSVIERENMMEYIEYLESVIDRLVTIGKPMEHCSKKWMATVDEWKGIDK